MISDFFTVVKFERATEWRASPGRCCHYATEPEPKDWFGRSETVHDSSHYSANSTWDSSFLLGIVQPEDMLWFPKRSTVAAWDGRCAVDRRVSDWKQWWAARRVFQDFAGRSCRSLAVTSSPAPGASLELMLTSHVILKISLYFGYISFCHISFGHICSKLCPQSYHNQSSLSSCPGLLVQMSDSQILVLQFSNLSCKTTLFFSPALISKVNNTLNGNFHKVKSRLAGTLRLHLLLPGGDVAAESSRRTSHMACIPTKCTRLIPMCSMMLAGSRMSLGTLRSLPAFTQAQVGWVLGRFLLK